MWLLTLKSVLVATDLGESSRSPLRTAARLAALAGASVHVLHVARDRMTDGDARLREDYRLAAPDAAEPDSVRVIAGSPADVTVEQAVKLDADVVILGPHRGPASIGGLGSTAASVVRAAPCPCLVAATELRLPLERVIVPIDGSEMAEAALSVALSWASALRPRGGETELAALHVARASAHHTVDPALHEEVERARKRAAGVAQVDIREEVVSGSDPAGEILRAAISASADLLVMGTRGAGGATGDLGSVSAAVARATPCPLLLVPPVGRAGRRALQA